MEVLKTPGFVSPRTRIRFELREGKNALTIYRPDGEPFVGYVEQVELAELERRRTDEEHQRAELEAKRAHAAEEQLQAERRRAAALLAQLRSLGIDPDA